MVDSLRKAWEAISTPEQDISPFLEFLPDKFRYTNSTNAWKKRTKLDGELPNLKGNVSFSVRGESVGPRSLKPTHLMMERQGGPALSLSSEWKSNSSSDQYRVILIDPRGTGSSIESTMHDNNSADKLVHDMELARKIAVNGKEEKIVLRGNCWGMTESILYVAAHPEKVAGLVLGLPFLARQKDIDWMYAPDGGLSKKLPDDYSKFWAYSRKTDPSEMMDQFVRDMSSDNPKVQAEAFCAFVSWEYAYYDGRYNYEPKDIDVSNQGIKQEIATRIIQARYTRDNFDIGVDGVVPLLRNVPKDIPIIILGNLFDPLNAPDTVSILRDELPQAQFLMQEADWHWLPQGCEAQGKSNDFIQQAYPFAMARMGFILENKIKPEASYQVYPALEIECPA